jgi:hypothetical protein
VQRKRARKTIAGNEKLQITLMQVYDAQLSEMKKIKGTPGID